MAASNKRLGRIRKLRLTQRGLEVFGSVIEFERNQPLKFLPPKKKIKFKDTDSLLLS